MLKKLFYIIPFFIFIFLITVFYFSSENIKKISKFRDADFVEEKNSNTDLPILKNDTNNIIVYKDDIEIYIKKRKKYRFWDLIKK